MLVDVHWSLSGDVGLADCTFDSLFNLLNKEPLRTVVTVFYRPDVFPIFKLALSKHQRKQKKSDNIVFANVEMLFLSDFQEFLADHFSGLDRAVGLVCHCVLMHNFWTEMIFDMDIVHARLLWPYLGHI